MILAVTATAAGLVTAVPGAVAATAPTMPQTFTKTSAPLPSFVTSTGTTLSLTRQTVAGLAAQRYGTNPGLTAPQAAAAQAGFGSSLSYPAKAAGPVLVASATGVLTGSAVTPETPDAPGCAPATSGLARRVTVTRDGDASYLTVSGPQRGGFVAGKAWRLPTYTTGGPTDVAVLEPSCQWGGPSAIAVTFPGGIDFYAFDGTTYTPAPANGVLQPSASYLGGGRTFLATAHVNADTSLLPVRRESDDGAASDNNSGLLTVTLGKEGEVVLHRLTLQGALPSTGTRVADAAVPVTTVPTGSPVTATVAYDNLTQGSPAAAAYALAVRSAGANSVWFGTIDRGDNTTNAPVAQSGACVGSDLPRLAVTNADNKGQDPFTGVVCTVTSGTGTAVQQWSDYTADNDDPPAPRFPDSTNPVVTRTLPVLRGVTPFVGWPCVLLTRAAAGAPTAGSCDSDVAPALVGTPKSAAPRFYQLPAAGAPGKPVSWPVAGGTAGAIAAVDQLPLTATTLTVKNTSTTATRVDSPPSRPVLFMMPAPIVAGLNQDRANAPVSFGVSSGAGSGQEASFATSTGATVHATLGDSAVFSAGLTASAEKSVGTTSGGTRTVTSSSIFNNNGNEPYVVYLTTPVWRWTGTVVSDTTGLSSSNGNQVVTDVAAPSAGTPRLAANSVRALGQNDPRFTATGTYGPTLESVFGPGVFDRSGPTVAGADPGAYPAFAPGSSATPTSGGAPYCDTPPAGRVGVATVNSGVRSPFTPADTTANGGGFLTSDTYTTVTVGDKGSDGRDVTVSDSDYRSYSTQFSVNASADITVANIGVSQDVGFSVGNQTTVTTSADQTFSAEIGHIQGFLSTGPNVIADRVNAALTASQTYGWQPFLCHRTADLSGGGQTSALVLGFATANFTGLPEVVDPTTVPKAVTGSAQASSAPTVARTASLALTRPTDGMTALYEAKLTSTSNPAVTCSLLSAAQTPRQSTTSAATQRLALARPVTTTTGKTCSLPAGTYRWTPVAYSFNGAALTGTPRYIKLA